MSPDLLFLDGELTIYRAAEVKDRLLGALVIASSAQVQVNLAGVSEIDSAGVQLLLLAQQTAGTMGRKLLLSAPSPAVCEVFALLNLASHFDGVQAAA